MGITNSNESEDGKDNDQPYRDSLCQEEKESIEFARERCSCQVNIIQFCNKWIRQGNPEVCSVGHSQSDEDDGGTGPHRRPEVNRKRSRIRVQLSVPLNNRRTKTKTRSSARCNCRYSLWGRRRTTRMLVSAETCLRHCVGVCTHVRVNCQWVLATTFHPVWYDNCQIGGRKKNKFALTVNNKWPNGFCVTDLVIETRWKRTRRVC